MTDALARAGALPGPWGPLAQAVLVVVFVVWLAVAIPSGNVLATFGWPSLLFLWATWLFGVHWMQVGWGVLDAERKNLDDAFAISAGGTRWLGKTARVVKLVFASKLQWAALRWFSGLNLLFWSWLLTLVWAWWLLVIPSVGFGWRLLSARRGWWETR